MKGNRFGGDYKPRWVIMKKDSLTYYDSYFDTVAPDSERGIVDLNGAFCVVEEGHEDFVFKIVTNRRVFYFACDSESDLYSWQDSFDRAKKKRFVPM